MKNAGPPPSASVNVTVGLVPLQLVFKVVEAPTPESVLGVYVGVRSAGPESVTLHEALIVVDTLNVSGMASAPAETAAKRAVAATSVVAVRVTWLNFKG
jgi:hypothetical protein